MVQFSIVIPCYNATSTILEALESLGAQTVTDWEAICVDDGSQDGTGKVIAEAAMNDPRIRLVHNERKGPSAARNLGAMKYARAAIIAFCDADDVWGPRKLEELADPFADETVSAVYGQIAFFKESPTDARVYSTVPQGDLTIPMLLGENPVCTMSNVAVRQEMFTISRGFDERLVHNEDLEWLIRLVGQGARVVGLDRLQVWYRASQTGLSADLSAMAVARQDAIQVAESFGFTPTPAANAVHYRYLARRALRLGQGRTIAFRFAMSGLMRSPRGFFNAPLRGGLTLVGSVACLFMPAVMSQALFSR